MTFRFTAHKLCPADSGIHIRLGVRAELAKQDADILWLCPLGDRIKMRGDCSLLGISRVPCRAKPIFCISAGPFCALMGELERQVIMERYNQMPILRDL